MRILRVADVPDVRTGGMQRVMYGTGDVLRAQGHSVEYLFKEGLRAPGPEKLRRFTVPVRVPLIVRELARRGRQYDVLEVHEPLAAMSCAIRRSTSGVPPVVAFSYGLEELGHRAVLDYRRRKGLPISLKARWSPLSVVLQARYAVRHADQVICSNARDVRYLHAAGVLADRLTEVPSGVTPEFLSAEPDWDRDPRSILFVGTWIMRKGTADLIPAVTRVLREEARARMTIAGCGVPAERVLAEFPDDVRSRVAVIAHLRSDRELIECYRRHAVFVLPSLFEGYPLAMLEAAALGLALVTTGVCGMDEFVENGENGFKVRVGEPKELADALLRLVRNGSETRRLGELARRKAQEFSWASAGSLVLGAYERAVGLGQGTTLATGPRIP